MACVLCDRVAGARTDRALVAELSECFVLLGDNQGLPAWCVLVLKEHREHLAEIDEARQLRVFAEVGKVAAAIRAVFPTSGKGGGPPRINYECLGNLVPHVHWHVIPRHADDPEPTKAVWVWPEEKLRGSMTDAEREELVLKLRAAMG